MKAAQEMLEAYTNSVSEHWVYWQLHLTQKIEHMCLAQVMVTSGAALNVAAFSIFNKISLFYISACLAE